MVRNALVHVASSAVIVAGLLVPAVSYAANSNSPYNQTGTNPAQSNCDSKTGCASYATGNRTKARPGMHSTARSSREQENRITAQLNQQQLAGAK